MCLFGKCGFPICPSHMVESIFYNSCKSVLQTPSGSCFVSKFCILSAVSAIDVCEFM